MTQREIKRVVKKEINRFADIALKVTRFKSMTRNNRTPGYKKFADLAMLYSAFASSAQRKAADTAWVAKQTKIDYEKLYKK